MWQWHLLHPVARIVLPVDLRVPHRAIRIRIVDPIVRQRATLIAILRVARNVSRIATLVAAHIVSRIATLRVAHTVSRIATLRVAHTARPSVRRTVHPAPHTVRLVHPVRRHPKRM
jgi:hypothetical protein